MYRVPVPLPLLLSRPIALVLAVLAVYGCWSTPGLVAHWGASSIGWAMLAAWCVLAASLLRNSDRAWPRGEVFAFALATVALRLGSLWLSAGRASPGDSRQYLALAHNLLAGRGLVVADAYMHLDVRALYPPLYPLLLAGWGAVAGLSAPSLLALSTVTDLFAAWAIARLGARCGSARGGVTAAALYLIWPSTLFDAPLAQKESLEVLLITTLALGWVDAARVDWRTAARIGMPAGLLALCQPGQAALAALFALAAVQRLGWGRAIALGARAGGAAMLVLLPWWVRNALVFGEFVPLTSAGGLSLWVGENSAATGNWMPYPPALTGLPELAYARAAARLAVDWMVHHPLDVVRLNAAKFVRAMGVAQSGLVRLAAMRPALGNTAAAALLPVSQASHLMLLAAASAVLAVRRVSPLAVVLLAACLAQLLIFGLWFEFGERHRDFVTPFLLLAVTSAGVRRRTAPAAASSARPAA